MLGLDQGALWGFIGSGLAAPGTAAVLLIGGLAAGRSKQRRQRKQIEMAIHELRRPLQSLLLQTAPDGERSGRRLTAIDLALAALNDLEAVLDYERHPRALDQNLPTQEDRDLGRLLEDAACRWRQAAWLRGGSIEVECRLDQREEVCPTASVELARALDNLILNALTHGGGRVRLIALRRASDIELRVCDSVAAPNERPNEKAVGESSRPYGGDDRRRHGHGLRAVRQIVAEHGGSFRLRRDHGGATAILRLHGFRDQT